MSKITSTEFADYIKKVHEHLEWSPPGRDRLRFMVLALCGEAGELANMVKKEWRGDFDFIPGVHSKEYRDRILEEHREKLIKELADVAGYAFLIAAELGVDLLWETYQKVQEAEQRPAFITFKNKAPVV